MTIYSTQQMLNQVIQIQGKCLECVKILGQNIYSTYFIAYKKTFKNGKISFVVDYDNGEEVWTNFDFEGLEGCGWKIYGL